MSSTGFTAQFLINAGTIDTAYGRLWYIGY